MIECTCQTEYYRPVFCDLDILKYALNTEAKNIFSKIKFIFKANIKKYFLSFINKKQWLSGSVSDWCNNNDFYKHLN